MNLSKNKYLGVPRIQMGTEEKEVNEITEGGRICREGGQKYPGEHQYITMAEKEEHMEKSKKWSEQE